MSLQHIQKNSPRLLPKPAKFEKNPPNGYRVIRKTKCGAGGAAGAGGAGGARSSPIHKQASLAGRLINNLKRAYLFLYLLTNKILFLTQLIILFNLPAKGNSEPKLFITLTVCFYFLPKFPGI